jgi:hypothetical protein
MPRYLAHSLILAINALLALALIAPVFADASKSLPVLK